MEILSQRDNRWKSVKLGFSDKTIGGYGCTITCLAMLSGLNPDEVNERMKSVNGFANKNLVIWKKIDEAIPWLKFEWRGWEYDNEKVKANVPCLVEVDGKRIGAKKHWVLYIGNKQMLDPWYGNQKATSYYPPTGYAIVKKVGDKPQDTAMSDLEKKYKHLKREYELEQQRLVDCRKDREKLERENKSLQNQLEEEDNARLTFIRTLANNLGTTQNQNEIIAMVRTLKENEAQLRKTLQKCETSIDLHVKEASKLYNIPLTSLQAVLEQLKASVSGENAEIEIIKPVLLRFWQFIKSFIAKVVKKYGTKKEV
jgi:hypothetical protein